MSKTSLPPGFRFHPTDVELVCYYLKRKVMGKTFHFEAISEIDLYKFAPWELPDKSILHSKDLEWYFFCPRDRKYPNGPRANRATGVGYWKTTGNDRYVIHKSRSVGTKKTLVFHLGKAPKGDRTNWVMYEYRLQDREFVDAGFSQDAYVLCKIFQKSGPGPKIGEQYGAPFNEEDWEDDTIVENLSFPYRSCPSPRSFNNPSSSSYTVLQQSRAFDASNVSSNPDLPEDDGISLEQLAEILSAPQLNSDDASAQMSDSAILHGVVNEISAVNIEGIYDDLEDLSAQATITGNIFYLDTIYNEHMLNTIPSVYENEHYVELNDLGFLGEDFTSDFVMPNYPSSQHPIACHPISHNLSNLFDSNSYIDSVITNASGVGDYLHAGPAMILEQSAQDVKIEAFGGSLLNPTCPIF